MAEFCFECFCKLIADTNDFPIVGEKKDLCEGCGQVKPVVVTTIPKPVRVLFLDYDGVVNTPMWNEDGTKCRYNFPSDGKVNNFQAVQWISEFCQKYGYHIVVTSTWRLDSNYKECLTNGGLRNGIEILGRTESLNNKCRVDEIKLYLESHPEIESYIIVDDEDDILEEQRPYFVETDGYVGFGLADVNKCERIHKQVANAKSTD